MYTTISGVNTAYGRNLGGLQAIRFVPKEWLLNELVATSTFGVMALPQLIPGKAWLSANCMPETMQYEETQKSSPAGDYWEAVITATCYKDEIGRRESLDAMRHHELIVICKDANKNSRIIGSKAKGMSVAIDYTTGRAAPDASMFKLTLSTQLHAPALVYFGA